MVSWDINVNFSGNSPHIQELIELSKKERFSNIESMELLDDLSYRICVNNRGLLQKEFEVNVVK